MRGCGLIRADWSLGRWCEFECGVAYRYVRDVAYQTTTLSSGAVLMYTMSMAKKRRRRGKVPIAAPPRISDGMMTGSNKNGLSAKKRLSSDYRIPSVRPVAAIIPAGPAIDADQFQLHAMEGLKHFAKHGDYTKLGNLMLNLPSKRHETLFANWCKRFARLMWDTKNRQFRWERGNREFDISSAATSRIGIGSRRSVAVVVIPPARTRPSVGNAARCAVCGAIAIPNEDTCYGHMSG